MKSINEWQNRKVLNEVIKPSITIVCGHPGQEGCPHSLLIQSSFFVEIVCLNRKNKDMYTYI